jgi:hypothetical protein
MFISSVPRAVVKTRKSACLNDIHVDTHKRISHAVLEYLISAVHYAIRGDTFATWKGRRNLMIFGINVIHSDARSRACLCDSDVCCLVSLVINVSCLVCFAQIIFSRR